MEVVLGIIEIPIANERFEVFEFGGKQLRSESLRVVAERIGEENKLAGQVLYRDSAETGAQIVDDNRRAGKDVPLTGGGSDFQSNFVDDLGLVESSQSMSSSWLLLRSYLEEVTS